MFTSTYAEELLLNHFETKSLKGFGVDGLRMAVVAAAALHYLKETQHNKSHIASLTRIEEDHFVWMINLPFEIWSWLNPPE